MSTELKGKIEKDLKKRDFTPDGVFKTVKNSLNGIRWYAKDGKSIILYVGGFIIEMLLGIIYKISGLEWILLICMLGVLLSVELLNTAIESVCDLISKKYNPLIRVAKDCGSGATFVIFTVLLILNIIIFYPKVIALF